jgi:tryptophan-rich sensory protein
MRTFGFGQKPLRLMATRSASIQAIGLAGWLLLCFAAAAIGAVASADAPTFYAQLSKPGWAPPASLFAPVWTVLYATMGIAAWLVWRTGPATHVRNALVVFVLQLAVNTLWSWIFFRSRLGAAAFAEILLLWVLIVATILLFSRHSRLAAALLLPYLAWVSFATALTFSTWQRNPQLL